MKKYNPKTDIITCREFRDYNNYKTERVPDCVGCKFEKNANRNCKLKVLKMKKLIIPICLLLSSCSLLKTKLPNNMGLSNSDIIVQKGAVLVEKGAIVVNNTFMFTISSGAFQTYLDRMSVFGGKEIYK